MVAAVGACPAAAANAANGTAGWWVVVATIPLTPYNEFTPEATTQRKRVEAAVARCSFRAFSDFSGKFAAGFRNEGD